ncbi:hypothetical protein [Streptomyces sp. NPDC005485]|uniref:hypothetical protein n=1 Tax=Streptomyces sp. NPDC005485 TaxID=3155591 RepID=UPI0033A3A007
MSNFERGGLGHLHDAPLGDVRHAGEGGLSEEVGGDGGAVLGAEDRAAVLAREIVCE